MKILVTGGAGFIGSNLVDALIGNGHEVFVVDNLSTGSKNNINSKAGFSKLDIRNVKLAKIFRKEKPEVVFHLAAQIDVRKSVADPINDAEQNILGSINLLENCRKTGVKKIIFSSTGGAIYGDTNQIPTSEEHRESPASPYGIGKLAVEKYLNYYHSVFGLSYVVLRYSNVYGQRQNSKGEAGVVAIFCDKLLSGQAPVINGDGKQTRDYVYVGDVVRANMLALESGGNETYNIGTGVETSVNELAGLIKGCIGSGEEFIHGPANKGEQQRSCLDCKKANTKLGWRPEVSLEEGIRKTVEWFKSKY